MRKNYLKLFIALLTVSYSIGLSAQGQTCAEATEITDGEYVAPALTGTGASNICFASGGTAAIWYSYTPAESGPVIVTSNFDPAQTDTRLSVYTGGCDALVCLESDDDGGDGFTSLLSFDAVMGETYLIEWDDRWSADGFSFSIIGNPSAPDCVTQTFPENGAVDVVVDPNNTNSITFTWDLATGGEMPDAYQLFFGTDPAELTNIGTISSGETSVQVNNIGYGDTFYWAIIPSSFGVQATGCDVFSFTTAFMIGDTDGDGVLDVDDCAPEDPLIYPGATCDDGDATTLGDAIQDDCTCVGVVPEPGELCEIALVVSEGIHTCTGPATGNGASNVCFGGGGVNAFWYSYTPTDDGQVTVSSDINEQATDTRFSVYSGDCSALECIGQDDDGGTGLTSIVVFDVVATQTYFIEWDDRWSADGFDFEISFISAVGDLDGDGIADIFDNCVEIPNADQLNTDGDELGDVCDDDDDNDGVMDADDCSPLDAAVFPGASCDDGDPETFADSIQADCSCAGVASPTNNFCDASQEIFEDIVYTDAGPFAGEGASNICVDGATNANWYLFVPAGDGQVTVSSSIDLDQPDTRVSVYTGTCDDLTCVVSDDDGGDGFTSIAVFDALGGTPYYIEWDDRWSGGEFDFIVTILSATDDTDGDGIFDIDDNCVDIANPGQEDMDFDEIGDACDDNVDGDTDLGDVDCDDMDPNVFFGAACDDGDAETTNDVILDDCTCVGIIPPVNVECDGSITVVEDVVIADPGPFAGEGASNLCTAGGTNSNWYVFVPTNTVEVTVSSAISTEPSDTRVSVYSGTCDDLTCIGFDDDSGGNLLSTFTFLGEAGTPYFIEWDDRWSSNSFEWIITTEVALDTDEDGIVDLIDNCPAMSNPGQEDLDADGVGDVCDDDIDGDNSPNEVDCDPLDSEVFVGAICDDGDPETVGDVLNADCACAGTIPSEGDVCDLGIPVNEGSFTAPGPMSAMGAANLCFESGATNANWYAYTATGSGVATVGSDLDVVDTRLSVYTGSCDSLTCLVSDDDGGGNFTSIVTFDVNEGDTYYIEWDDRWSTSGFEFYIDLLTGIENVESDDAGVQLFPNPVMEDMTVQFVLDEAAEVIYEVYDISGKLMLTEMYANDNGLVRQNVNVGSLSSGFYLMKIIVGDQQVTKKFNVIK